MKMLAQSVTVFRDKIQAQNVQLAGLLGAQQANFKGVARPGFAAFKIIGYFFYKIGFGFLYFISNCSSGKPL